MADASLEALLDDLLSSDEDESSSKNNVEV